MKTLLKMLLIMSVLNQTSIFADGLKDKLFGVWKSEEKSKDKFTCTFNKDTSFRLTAVHKVFHLGTNGKYSTLEKDNKILLHLYDLSFVFIRSKHYGGLVEFIDDNTLRLDLYKAKKSHKVTYPKTFGRGTIIFYRQKS